MTDEGATTGLLVVDSLQGLNHVEPVAARAQVPAPLVPSVDSMLHRLKAWERDFVSGQAPATTAAVRSDWAQYIAWCDGTGVAPLPADFDQLEAFLRNAIVKGRKRSTIDRYVYTIGLIHEAAGLRNPFKDFMWQAKWKILVRELAAKRANARKQTAPLSRADLNRILATMGNRPRDLRDAAMISLASDSMLRESELVAVEVEDLAHNPTENTWSLVVPFSKTNQEGTDGDFRHVSRATIKRIRAWQAAAGITSGVLFRPIGGRKRDVLKNAQMALQPLPILPLGAQEVARIFKRRAKAAGIEHAIVITGHSTRVGMANDLSEHGATDLQIAAAGGWKSLEMVRYYTRKTKAGRNAVADFLKSADRDGGSDG